MRPLLVSLAFACAAGAGTTPSLAADPCAAFKWDVTPVHTLFTQSGTSLTAGKDLTSAPTIATDHLYQLQLAPQDQVTFALAPGKKMLTDGAFAGVAALKLKKPGTYLVSVDVPFWIDVVADGKLVATKDFQGQQGCDEPHKIVEFDLAAAHQFVLQVSGSTKASVRLTVTESPGPKP
jgi:hypothetical protein